MASIAVLCRLLLTLGLICAKLLLRHRVKLLCHHHLSSASTAASNILLRYPTLFRHWGRYRCSSECGLVPLLLLPTLLELSCRIGPHRPLEVTPAEASLLVITTVEMRPGERNKSCGTMTTGPHPNVVVDALQKRERQMRLRAFIHHPSGWRIISWWIPHIYSLQVKIFVHTYTLRKQQHIVWLQKQARPLTQVHGAYKFTNGIQATYYTADVDSRSRQVMWTQHTH